MHSQPSFFYLVYEYLLFPLLFCNFTTGCRNKKKEQTWVLCVRIKRKGSSTWATNVIYSYISQTSNTSKLFFKTNKTRADYNFQGLQTEISSNHVLFYKSVQWEPLNTGEHWRCAASQSDASSYALYLSTGGDHPLFFFGWGDHGDATHSFKDILLFLMVNITTTNKLHTNSYLLRISLSIAWKIYISNPNASNNVIQLFGTTSMTEATFSEERGTTESINYNYL